MDIHENEDGGEELFVDVVYTPEKVTMKRSDVRRSRQKVESPDYKPTIKESRSPSKSKRVVPQRKSTRRRSKKAVLSESEGTISEEEGTEVRTPVLTSKGSRKPDNDSKSEHPNAVSSLDISPFVKSSRYGQQDQKFKMFWLPNSEISSLMRIPSIAQMSSSRKESCESLYIVFTPGGMDVIQNASHIAGVERRPFRTPFVILYSYSFRSMYFKVVARSIDSCFDITFNENGESGTVTSGKGSPGDNHSRNRASTPENTGYEFYRSYLYGIDGGATTRRIMVSLRNVKETVLDMRDASVEDEANGRLKLTIGDRSQVGDFPQILSRDVKYRSPRRSSSRRRAADLSSARSSDSMEFDGGVSLRTELANQNVPRHSTRGYWIYESTEDYERSDEETVSGLPVVLLSEIKRLIGLEDVTKLLQCNLGMVNQRMEAMIKRNFFLYDKDDNCITDDVKGCLEVIEDKSSDSKAAYRANDKVIHVGDVIVVKIPSLYRKYYEEDTIKIYDMDTLSLCFTTLESLSSEELTDITMALAQYCPNIFWNIVFMGNVEQVLSRIAPNICGNSRKRRQRVKYDTLPGVVTPTRPTSKPNTVPVFDNNFVIMQNLFEHDAQHKIERLKKFKNQQRHSNGAVTRKSISKYLDSDDLISTVMHPEGFLLKSMGSLTTQQKIVVYQTCLRRGIYAPIRLDYVPKKGRAVFAAYDIGKDEFVVEYKGQIITEKVAKFRDQKYDQSRSYKGSFVFYFKVKNKRYCIDATEEDIMFGPARLINHSRKNPNIVPKALELDDCPRLFFVAKRNIKSGEELLIDYGERDPSVIKDNPWLLD